MQQALNVATLTWPGKDKSGPKSWLKSLCVSLIWLLHPRYSSVTLLCLPSRGAHPEVTLWWWAAEKESVPPSFTTRYLAFTLTLLGLVNINQAAVNVLLSLFFIFSFNSIIFFVFPLSLLLSHPFYSCWLHHPSSILSSLYLSLSPTLLLFRGYFLNNVSFMYGWLRGVQKDIISAGG